MTILRNVDGFDFTSAPTWKATRYDAWKFYRSHNPCGKEAVDILAISIADKTGYLIEIKDYSRQKATLPSQLPEILFSKTLHTLAMLLPTAVNSNEEAESSFAREFLRVKLLRVFYHIEQPQGKIPPIDLADIQQKLIPWLRGIDAAFRIVSLETKQLPWKVNRAQDRKHHV